MKTFLKKFLVGLAVLLSVSTATSVTQNVPVYANENEMGSEGRCNQAFLGMKPWDCGIDPKWGSDKPGEEGEDKRKYVREIGNWA